MMAVSPMTDSEPIVITDGSLRLPVLISAPHDRLWFPWFGESDY